MAYCDMPSPEMPEKSCQEYVKYQKYLVKTHSEATRLHKQIYNQKANKVKRTGNTALMADLDKFKAKSEQWRDEVRNGKKKEFEYIEWLRMIIDDGKEP